MPQERAIDPRPGATAARNHLLDIAMRRWDGILERRPDLKPAVDLQQRLLNLVIELAQTIDGGRLPRLSLPPKYIATKLTRGVPAFAGEPIPLPVRVLHDALLRLCGALAEGGAGEAAEHIRSAIESGRLEAGSLLAASLAREQTAIRTAAVQHGLAPDLVWLVAELAVSPFAHALQRTFFASPAPENWKGGYCPACGSWPALAEVVGGHRVLRCSFCALAWELATYACIYCGEDADLFVTAAPEEERKDRRVEICKSCGGYLKTVDAPELSPFPLLAIADLETMDLDLAAMERGYGRPTLKEFATGRSPQNPPSLQSNKPEP